MNENLTLSDAPSREFWEPALCPGCGRAVQLYRCRVHAMGRWSYIQIELRDGEYTDVLCKQCVLDLEWMVEKV